jgi:hypothetical protein
MPAASLISLVRSRNQRTTDYTDDTDKKMASAAIREIRLICG